MGFAILMLTLQTAATPLAARVVEPPQAPVSLVGLPCGNSDDKRLAIEPAGQGPGPNLQSQTFQCELNCRVGFRVRAGANVDSIIVATAAAYDRGRVVVGASPWLKLSSLRSCGEETYVDAVVPNTGWPLHGAYFWVAEVKFQDGTIWKVDEDNFTADVLAKEFVAPRRGKE
jgi:hypothetical protein